MTEIQHVLRRASARLLLIDWLRTSAITITAALSAMVLLRLVENLRLLDLWFGRAELLPWQVILPAGIGAALVAALVWSFIRRGDPQHVARVVDERANLHESISTALCVQHQADGWSRAVVDTARDQARRVVMRDALPVTPPRLWPVPAALALAFAIVWFVRYDLASVLNQKQVAAREEARQIEVVRRELEQELEPIRDLAREAGIKLDEQGAPEASPEPGLDNPDPQQTAEDLQQQALRELTRIEDKLRQELEERQSEVEAFADLARQLDDPGRGPMEEAARQLARGDFKQAKQALEQLKDKLDNNKLSADEKAMLKEQADKMAKQLDELSKQTEALEEQLKQAGLNEQQAADVAKQVMDAARNAESPQQAQQAAQQAMQQAMQQMQQQASQNNHQNNQPNPSQDQQQNAQQTSQPSPQQMQQLMQQASSCANASQQAQNMSKAASAMSQAMQKGDQSQASQSASQMGQQMSAMEMAQAECQNMQASLGQCQSASGKLSSKLGNMANSQCQGSGRGPFREGSSQAQGKGSGGPGQGNGGTPGPDAEKAGYTVVTEKADVDTRSGPIIGRTTVYEAQVRGESTAGFQDATTAALAEATEAIESKRVPKEYEKAVQAYFGRLQERAKRQSEQTPAAPAGQPAAAASSGESTGGSN